MARLSGSVLGNLSGKLGNLSARTVDGETILAARPSSFEVSQSPGSVAARQRFAVTVSFSKMVLALSVLFSIWDKVKISGMSVFNTIFKKNHQFSNTDKPTADNILTPGGFALPVNSAVLASDNLTVEIDALNTVAVFDASEVNLALMGLVVYHNPIDPDDPDYKIIKLSKSLVGFDFTSVYNGVFNLDVVQQQISDKYQDSIIYLAAASQDNDDKVVQYSSTYSS
jgi:hypothetical protein